MPQVIRGIRFSHPVPAGPDGRPPHSTSKYGPRSGGLHAIHYGHDILHEMFPGEHKCGTKTNCYPESQLSARRGIYGWISLNGTPALAAADGKVTIAKGFGTGGGIRIDHGQGLATDYIHLDVNRFLVKKGDYVKRGQPIGIISYNTMHGTPHLNHLHFQFRKDGGIVDPEPYMTGWEILPNPFLAKQRLARIATSPWLWALVGVGGAAGAWYWLSRTRRLPPKYAFPTLAEDEVGLAPPNPRQKHDMRFDPWSPKARRKRAAQEFLDVRTNTVKDIAPRTLPKHIRPFAEYMRRASKRPVSGRDIVKAYLVTVGSMQRAAIGAGKVRARWRDFPGPRSGLVRPEDVLSDLLRSPVGQRYLAAAADGRLDRSAAKVMARRFGAFGFGNMFAKQLSLAPGLAADAPRINKILKTGRRSSWYKYVVKNVNGVDIAKAGFLASLMGRGDMATADARELNFWLCPVNKWNRDRRACNIPLKQRYDVADIVDEDFVEILNKKMRALKIKMPVKYKPFYEHLAHHAIWDAVGNTATTHAEIINAMEEI